jgi:DNA polymerase-3 subunit gamma/tau
VLATTDPQKVSETIRSRVQHLQFHLLPVAELKKYVKFVIKEAQLTVDNDSIDLVLRQGGGSARDTLSALELIVSGGGEPEVALHTEDIIKSLVARDHAEALGAVARAMQQGRDPHTYAQDVVRTCVIAFLHLCHLSWCNYLLIELLNSLVMRKTWEHSELYVLWKRLAPPWWKCDMHLMHGCCLKLQ